MQLLETTKRAALRQWVPPARLQLDRWIEETIVLPSSISALPGPVRLYSYQVEVARSIADPLVEKITLCKASRLGFSTLLVCAVGHYAVNEPSAVIVVLPRRRGSP
jgi:phage terminase large subunit GpA-like protein